MKVFRLSCLYHRFAHLDGLSHFCKIKDAQIVDLTFFHRSRNFILIGGILSTKNRIQSAFELWSAVNFRFEGFLAYPFANELIS